MKTLNTENKAKKKDSFKKALLKKGMILTMAGALAFSMAACTSSGNSSSTRSTTSSTRSSGSSTRQYSSSGSSTRQSDSTSGSRRQTTSSDTQDSTTAQSETTTGQIQEYIEKIDRKAHQIKQLSDNIFEYALITEETEVELGNPEPLESVFYDLLSEAAFYLTEHGYTPDIWLEKGGGNIRVNMEYINRILDNLVSNIIKYADHSSPVVIRSVYGDKEGGLSFENQKNENSSLSKKKEESTNIGIHNICKMMKKMHGYCKVEQNTHTFKILLQFPYT